MMNPNILIINNNEKTNEYYLQEQKGQLHPKAENILFFLSKMRLRKLASCLCKTDPTIYFKNG